MERTWLGVTEAQGEVHKLVKGAEFDVWWLNELLQEPVVSEEERYEVTESIKFTLRRLRTTPPRVARAEDELASALYFHKLANHKYRTAAAHGMNYTYPSTCYASRAATPLHQSRGQPA
jgi:hypothetical protein